MKNVIFISPNFPTNYWQFCRALKSNGLNVLGIGDQPYDELSAAVRENVTEYYWVDSLENNDAVYRAVAFFIHKYGRIDWLESNNEYWLERDAWLRTQFHITSGFQAEDMEQVKYKSKMKELYAKAGIPVCRHHMAEDFDDCITFIKEVGWPVVVKPDNGVSASDAHKLENEDDLRRFLQSRTAWVPYIMEEFVCGEVCSYDAVIDSKGDPIFETGTLTAVPTIDVVSTCGNAAYCVVNTLAPDVQAAGRAAAKAWAVKSRFVHFEFFRLTQDHPTLGKKGTLVGLEVNMRPCGGFTTDMMNFAHSTDVYQIWADMIAFDHSETTAAQHNFCAFVGRRDGKEFALSDSDLMKRYYPAMRMVERIPDVLADTLGNRMYAAVFATEEEVAAIYRDALAAPSDEPPAPKKKPAAKKSVAKKPAAKKPAAKPSDGAGKKGAKKPDNQSGRRA